MREREGNAPLEVVETNRRYVGRSSGRGYAYPSVFDEWTRVRRKEAKKERKKKRKKEVEEREKERERGRGTEEREREREGNAIIMGGGADQETFY